MSKEKLLLTEEMIAPIVEQLPNGEVILHLDQLSANDRIIFMPLILFSLVTVEIADFLEDKELTETIVQVSVPDVTHDPDKLIEAINELLERVVLVASPDTPPHWEGTGPDGLFLALTNYFILWLAFYNHLKHGDRAVTITWEETYDLEDMTLPFYFLVAAGWVHMAIHLISDYVKGCYGYDLVNDGNEELEDVVFPYPYLPILKKEGNKVDVEGPIIGFQVDIAKPKQELYDLWLQMWFDGKVEFTFLPLFEEGQDDVSYRKKLLGLMMIIEEDIQCMTRDVKKAWKQFVNEPERAALQDEEEFVNWCYEALNGFKHIIFKSRSLSRCLATLDIYVRSEKVEKLVNDFKKLFKKQIPQEIQLDLRQASLEIVELFKAARSSHKREYASEKDRTNKALKHFRNFPDRFKFITEQDVQDITFDGENAPRDAKRLILPRVAERLGKSLKAWHIEQIL